MDQFVRKVFPFAQMKFFGWRKLVEVLKVREAFEKLKKDGTPLQYCRQHGFPPTNQR